MADRILSVQTISASDQWEESNKIALPALWDTELANGGQWGQGYNYSGSQWYPSDRVVYIFDNFTGSIELVQESGSSAGLTIYDDEKTPQSGPWRLIGGPPQYIYNSGSNDQTVKVTVVLVR